VDKLVKKKNIILALENTSGKNSSVEVYKKRLSLDKSEGDLTSGRFSSRN
jgi:hypothetical protein